ncbi:MAG: prepilin-type N-terminal cleavage/methylation domain-containing protein [Candidatus Kerfeldbacteria bacterium]|nr:prepilin-type N-terminal cleavage/methylation domain-containing protein [Candidatus Kerfeldbacteria bacterium]
MNKGKKIHGFTLLELLVVIGIIGILAAIVIIAINPGRQFAQARNAQRWNDVNAILNAVHQYAVDNNGEVPAAITAVPTTVSNGGIDICDDLVGTTGIYVTAIPADPQTGSYTDCTTYNSGYQISQNATSGRVTVTAPSAELTTTITVSR